MDRYYDHVYGLGCHRSLPDYNCMEKAQDRIWAAQLPKAMLEECMSKLPSLRSVILSDWRELARSGESYDETASRLFGNSLAPRISERGGSEILSEVEMLFRVTTVNPRIESLSTGSPLHGNHESGQYEHLVETGQLRPIDAMQSLPSISFMILQQVLIPQPLDFSNLRQLDLHIGADEVDLDTLSLRQLKSVGIRMALSTMMNLTHLSLGLARATSSNNIADTGAVGEDVVVALLSGLHFLNLQSLRLEGWKIMTDFLESILKLHASTIRSVKLIHCSIHGDTKHLAEWAAANLQLDGVSLESARGSSDVERAYLAGEEDLWLANRKNHVVRDSKLKVVGYSSDGKYVQDERRPWWTQKLVWN